MVSVFLLGGSSYLFVRQNLGVQGEQTAYVATVDLPSFHVIQKDDVVLTSMASDKMPENPATRRDQIVGHFTVQEVAADQPISLDSIGALAPPDSESWPVLTIVGDQAATLAGRLRPGDRADVLLSALPDGSLPPRVLDVLVLHVGAAGSELSAVTIALPEELDERQAASLTSGGMMVLRR